MNKPKHQHRTTVSLSFSAPVEIEELMDDAALWRGMNRSQYICWLVRKDLDMSGGVRITRAARA